MTGLSRNPAFMNYSNSYHRYACVNSGGFNYCGHFFAYYFLKDKLFPLIESGHRHDWEQSPMANSTHGNMVTAPESEIPKQDGHLKFKDEVAENPVGTFVLPTVVSWYTMKGDGIDNAGLREKLDYEHAHNPIKDGDFLSNLNEGKPTTFPQFTQESVDTSK
ncbi:hypothetical protein AC1031_018094 [Aphanomyces cochlioides]|nr:hypothetical protein AC1031_018094 [Aphanomyces cochlioides]